MEDPKIKIYSILEKVASDLGVEASNFLVEKQKDSSHGDFSSNIALALFNSRGKSHVAKGAEVDTKIVSLPAQDSKKLNLKSEGSNESSENFVSPRASGRTAFELIEVNKEK